MVVTAVAWVDRVFGSWHVVCDTSEVQITWYYRHVRSDTIITLYRGYQGNIASESIQYLSMPSISSRLDR